MEDAFDGHHFCDADPWHQHPLTVVSGAAWPFHPKPAGQEEIAHRIASVIRNPSDQLFFDVGDGERLFHSFLIPNGKAHRIVSTRWPGSDVEMTLTSPSGDVIGRDEPDVVPGVDHEVGPTYESYTVADPEPGAWKVELFGKDVDPLGERVALTTKTLEAPNQVPEARLVLRRRGREVVVSAERSRDPDGTVTE